MDNVVRFPTLVHWIFQVPTPEVKATVQKEKAVATSFLQTMIHRDHVDDKIDWHVGPDQFEKHEHVKAMISFPILSSINEFIIYAMQQRARADGQFDSLLS